jgi:hypothetical protein
VRAGLQNGIFSCLRGTWSPAGACAFAVKCEHFINVQHAKDGDFFMGLVSDTAVPAEAKQ